MSLEIGNYAEALLVADKLDDAFREYERQVSRLGFDGALYTYIPDAILQSSEPAPPLYQVSSDYAPKYLDHYQEARYDKVDPLIMAVSDGVKVPIDWTGKICRNYMRGNKQSREVIEESHCYGIRRGFTLPLKMGSQGIAGTSVIVTEKDQFKNLDQRISELKTVATLYHNYVAANDGHLGTFLRPAFDKLNKLEINFLAGLALGKSINTLAAELHRSPKYLEQVLMRIRVKVSGVDENGRPKINRDQLMYYAGAVQILSAADRL